MTSVAASGEGAVSKGPRGWGRRRAGETVVVASGGLQPLDAQLDHEVMVGGGTLLPLDHEFFEALVVGHLSPHVPLLVYPRPEDDAAGSHVAAGHAVGEGEAGPPATSAGGEKR